ncbi:DUF2264 domain-containing protein [Rugosimonospora africana]|uniref:DUF2264 domain-containing protein n=1 Tax=Rugosimonospora africana TaxID=556532 RepID=A0A8J3VR09_9ACTN|nr:DUF2264 domain-containing protein [Rugosimonospora africana]GIH14908.1 hypothetical protein Raf01_30800 [Rugosimonospora africana]
MSDSVPRGSSRPGCPDPPEPSGSVSPHTGLVRADWETSADNLLDAVRPYASASFARISLPGAPSWAGPDSDALEGFARTFLLAALRIAGAQGDPAIAGPLLDRYARGLAAGADQRHADAWPRIDADGCQQIVESASIAIALQLTRPWLWDNLPAAAHDHIVQWLGGIVGRQTPRSNWVLFRTVVEEFLAIVGGPHRHDEIVDGLHAIARWQLDDGWYTDGEGRRVDHYNGWALHLYPLLWTDLAASGPRSALAAELRERYRARLRAFLADYVQLIGGDGAPLHQGRSLTYRLATAASLWTGALFDATPLAPGLTRRAASGILRYFTDRGAPDDAGLLRLGWLRPFRGTIQPYSGPASPYWASKGFLGLLLPPSHPVWVEEEQPLPVERRDVLHALPGPNWLVQATHADGIVRVHNHGSDGVARGSTTDNPHYARLCFTTVTAPRSVPTGPVADASITVTDPDGTQTGWGRIQPLGAQVTDGVGHAASWHSPAPGVRIESHALAFGRYEVRLHAVRAPRGWLVRDSGYNLSGTGTATVHRGKRWTSASDRAGRCTAVAGLHGYRTSDVDLQEEVDALGGASAVPYLLAQHPGDDRLYASCLVLSGEPLDADAEPPVVLSVVADEVTIELPGGDVWAWRFAPAEQPPTLVPISRSNHR